MLKVNRLLFSISSILLVLKASIKSFQLNNNFQISAALALYGFFAFIPLLLLVIYLLGNYIVSSQSAIEGIQSLTSEILPQFSAVIIKEVHFLSEHKNIWGPISIVTLFWSITPLTGVLRTTFLRIFKTDKEISFFRAKLFDAVAVLIMLVLFIILVISEISYPVITKMFLTEIPLLLEISNIVAPLLMTTLFMSLFYLVFSPVKPRISQLLIGSFATAILWVLMRHIFFIFLKYNPGYGFAFGSLKIVFIVIMWVYFSFAVILFGAEIIANLKRKDALLLKGLFSAKRYIGKIHRMLIEKFIKRYNASDVIFKEGEYGNNMFYILSGSVNISRKGFTLKVMKENEYFGEMSMLLGTPRTATATVLGPDTQLVVISQDNFEIILREEPKIVLSVLKEMAQRLKMTNEYL